MLRASLAKEEWFFSVLEFAAQSGFAIERRCQHFKIETVHASFVKLDVCRVFKVCCSRIKVKEEHEQERLLLLRP